MKIRTQRGENIFIVEEGQQYHLVNIELKSLQAAELIDTFTDFVISQWLRVS